MPDTGEQTTALIGAYYAAFNAMDVEAILACLDAGARRQNLSWMAFTRLQM